jgi:putative redox protein
VVEMNGTYLGELHCELIHGPSQNKIQTDAPKDNNGRGLAFSPTDLVGAALGSCVLTTMAIVADRDGILLKGSTVKVQKEMVTTPVRKIGRLITEFKLPKSIPEDYRKKLERVAETCPVHRSLDHEVKIEMTFSYVL